MDKDTTPISEPKQRLYQTLASLKSGAATTYDVESGISAAVQIARETAMGLHHKAQRHKHRFKKVPTPLDSDEAKAYYNTCGNMAAQINMLLDEPELNIRHHQLRGKGYSLNHHILSVTYQDMTWVVDASAQQFTPQLGKTPVAPETEQLFEKGFVHDQDHEGDTLINFFKTIDKRATFDANLSQLLATTEIPRPNLGDVEQAFIAEAQETRQLFKQKFK